MKQKDYKKMECINQSELQPRQSGMESKENQTHRCTNFMLSKIIRVFYWLETNKKKD